MTTMTQFLAGRGITMAVELTDCNPDMPDFDGDHWRCVLKRGRKRMTTFFSMGSGHRGREPRPEEVLDCLARDASGYENALTFAVWCSGYGYDSDSRKAERIYGAGKRGALKLRQFLGEADYVCLLHRVERL